MTSVASQVLEGFVCSLNAPYGFERSMKMRPGKLLADRWLMTLHKSALGSQPELALKGVAEQLGAPNIALNACLEMLSEADVVHFGYEGEGAHSVCKLYLEFASQVRQLMEAGELSGKVQVHHSLKWSTGDPQRYAFNDYWLLPECASEWLIGRVCSAFESSCQYGTSVVQFVDRVLQRARLSEVMCLQVVDPAASRHSYDLNLYDAEMTLADIADDVYLLGAGLNTPKPELQQWLVEHQYCDLGHIATGLDNQGQPFITLYFGVEAR